ncbi:MAG: ribonuclease HI family protein [Thermodesulfovibrionales bacterium]|nr:ribonuclease HI family protein [Thermodesulfovibrionales bacterium]
MRGILYCDGASRGNPGHAGIGVVLLLDGYKKTISEYIGVTTNNVAEYKALLIGLQEAKKEGIKDIEINLDSELIVKQIRGIYKIKSPNLKSLYNEVITCLGEFRKFYINHIPRALNKEADKLANAALDKYHQG